MTALRVILTVLGLCDPLLCLADGAPVGAEPAGPAADVTVDTGVWRQHHAVISQVAGQYGIEAALLHAVIAVESRYDSRAVSPRGAAGLMQLMPVTARRFGVENVFDPVENVRAGAQHLIELLKLFDKDVSLALAAYNAGEGAVIRHGRRIPPYRETAAYVLRVLGFYEKYRALK